MTTTAGLVSRRHLDPIRTGADCRPAPADLPAAEPPSPEPAERLRVVPPDAVPAGAVVLGMLAMLPADAAPPGRDPGGGVLSGQRRLVALPAALSAGLPAALSPGLPGTLSSALPSTRASDGAAEPLLLDCGPGLVLDRWGRRVLLAERELSLTRREYELFERLVTHPGRVFTRSQLLAEVWDVDDPRFASVRTVDVHVARLRRKLGAEHATALHSLRGVGYRWSAPTSPLG